MKDKPDKKESDIRPEYEFDYSEAVRGKYYKRLLEQGSNVVVLDPDVADSFHDSESVNEALRAVISLTYTTRRLTKHVSEREKPHYKTEKTRHTGAHKDVTVRSGHLKTPHSKSPKH